MSATPRRHLIATHLFIEGTIVSLFAFLFTILVGEVNDVTPLEGGPVKRGGTIPMYRWIIVSLGIAAMAISGFRERHLTFSGSIAAFVVGITNGVLG